jgi:hypothetical protein
MSKIWQPQAQAFRDPAPEKIKDSSATGKAIQARLGVG